MLEQFAVPKFARSIAMRYFVEVAEKGSFRGAAEALNIAASAINRHVSNLEEDLGVKLFERARGRAGLRLTDAGAILQFRVRSAFNELRIANDEINALQGLQRGHVIIGVNEGLATNLIPHAVADFHRRYPGITYSIMVDNTRKLVQRLRDGDVDFAIGYNFPLNAQLRFVETISLKMFIITPIGHPLSSRSAVGIADLENVDLVLPDSSLLLRQTFDLVLRRSMVHVRSVVETSSFDLIYSLVEAGIGVGIVTGKSNDTSKRSDVAYVEINDVFLASNVLACCHLPERSISAAASAFMEKICEILRRSSGITTERVTVAV